ncbi:MAG: BrnA antitoxin family protein [Methylococcaceae bacterium]
MKKYPENLSTEDKEREFWSESESTEYIDWSAAKKMVLPNLKPTTRKISLRLPEIMIDELKVLANKRDIPYQALLKIYLAEKITQELHSN